MCVSTYIQKYIKKKKWEEHFSIAFTKIKYNKQYKEYKDIFTYIYIIWQDKLRKHFFFLNYHIISIHLLDIFIVAKYAISTVIYGYLVHIWCISVYKFKYTNAYKKNKKMKAVRIFYFWSYFSMEFLVL